jgi:polynucleotide 5'-kinase involved in rRNA processing
MKNGMIVDKKGSKIWYKNDQLHREDGPAIEFSNGDKSWYINGQLHREEGPACEYVVGRKEWHLKWHLNGVHVPKYVVLQPEKITLEKIKKARNNEVRSIMIERYGWQRYLVDSQAQVIDKRHNVIENTKEALFATRSLGNRLVVTCPTGRVFTLGVPSDAKTCEEAQKWLGNASAEINVIGRT